MANDKVEFDLTINGKQAKKTLEEIESDLSKLEKQDKKTASTMKADWVAIGAAVTAAAYTLGSMISKANELERATQGLNDETKDYIKSMSNLTGISQTVIAGFVQTGKSAGMTGDQIENMIDTAIRLGKAYPHESVETFIDNLSMLNTSGEAQGYIVDILEQRYGMLDLKLISTADKLKAVTEASKGFTVEGTELDKSIQSISNTFTSLGNTALRLGESTGIFWIVEKSMLGLGVAMGTVEKIALGVNAIFKEITNSDQSKLAWAMYEKKTKELDEQIDSLLGKQKELFNGEITISKSTFEKPLSDLQKFDKMISEIINDLKGDGLEPEQLLFSIDAVNQWATQVREAMGKGLKLDQAMKAAGSSIEAIANDSTKRIDDMNQAMLNNMSNAISQFVITGKGSMKDFANSVIADLIRIQIRYSLLQATGGGNVLGTLGLHTGGEVKHTGGYIGGGSHIPSYHSGMRSDERIAKLQVGESVVNRAGTANNAGVIDAMNSGRKIGNGGVVLNIENNTGMPISADMISSNEDSENRRIINIVMDSVANNVNGSRDFIKGL